MCRLLLVRSDNEFDIVEHLRIFSELSKNSKEYQGHGWGCSYLFEEKWIHYKNIKPIWEDDFKFGKARLLIAHARSAYKDLGIKIENNMPFYDDKYVFVFNGELQGVKINADGRIGAEKIFNYIKRFDKGDMEEALKKAVPIIEKRSRYIKAMNIIISDKEKAYVSSLFNEQPDYFTLHYNSDNEVIICSDPYPNETNWSEIKNKSIMVF